MMVLNCDFYDFMMDYDVEIRLMLNNNTDLFIITVFIQSQKSQFATITAVILLYQSPFRQSLNLKPLATIEKINRSAFLKQSLRISPGAISHKMITNLEGERYSTHFGSLRTEGMHVYITGVKPFNHKLTFS